MKKIVIFLCLFITLTNFAKESEDLEEPTDPIKIGNFAVPGSQQPGSLLGFGHSLVGKGILQAFVFPNVTRGHCLRSNEFFPGFIYGITDLLSVLVTLPIASRYQIDNAKSSGVEDMLIQAEYGFFTRVERTFIDWASVVALVTLPTGSTTTNPPLGFGSPNFFFGLTLNHMAIDWYYFFAPGFLLTTTNKECIKYGNHVLYEGGLGRNIAWGDEWICTAIVEVDGVYVQRTKENNIIDPNSGGNIIYIAPSLWIATKKMIIQGGVQFPISQYLFGVQNTLDYQITAGITYTF